MYTSIFSDDEINKNDFRISIINGDAIVDIVYASTPSSSNRRTSDLFVKHLPNGEFQNIKLPINNFGDNRFKYSKIFDIIDKDELDRMWRIKRIPLFMKSNKCYDVICYDLSEAYTLFNVLYSLMTKNNLKTNNTDLDYLLSRYDMIHSFNPASNLIIPVMMYDIIDLYVFLTTAYIYEFVEPLDALTRNYTFRWTRKWFGMFYDNLLVNFPEHKSKIIRMKSAIVFEKMDK